MSDWTKPAIFMMPVPFSIPAISDELLAELCKKIVPVTEVDGQLFYVEDVDPRTIAFTWDPKVKSPAIELNELVTLRTLHSYGAPSLFKPSIAEVLAQIPAAYLDVIVAFKTKPNETNVNYWPEADKLALNWGYHLGYTTLYVPM